MVTRTFAEYFPYHQFPSMTENQTEAFNYLEQNPKIQTVVFEAPTGSGKTLIGGTWLERERHERGSGHFFYLVPNKTQVDQVVRLYPNMKPVYGRNEHACLFFEDDKLQADEIPCELLVECPHRVDQETGETHLPGARPCPYLQQKYEARTGSGLVVATHAFYLFAVFFGQQFQPAAVVVDEAHGLAKSLRSVLEHRITDRKLTRIVAALRRINAGQYHQMMRFLRAVIRTVRKHPAGQRDERSILTNEQIGRLVEVLEAIDTKELKQDIRAAVDSGVLDPRKDRELLRQLQTITRSLKTYLSTLKFAMAANPQSKARRRHPSSYIFAFWLKGKMQDKNRTIHELVIRSYNVAPLIERMLPKRVLAYSATVCDEETFGWENGIRGEFKSLRSTFPSSHTRIFMPTDTPNLSVRLMRKGDKKDTHKLVARAAKQFADRGIRSLVVVTSDQERDDFLAYAKVLRLEAVSYGGTITPRVAARKFRDEGKGMVLVGTASNYGEGLDLPNGTAPVIFFYRPGYASPRDPQTAFEERRWGAAVWSLWNWRVMIELLQVRGRNIRSPQEIGVTFLISQQFRRFVRATLPPWLRPAYVDNRRFKACVEEAMVLLGCE
jgi:Rad3-related DNA helicase